MTFLEHWRVRDYNPGEGDVRSVTDCDAASSEWIDVAAPGDVYVGLIEAGRLPDPFFGMNETSARWVQDKEWWYRTSFEAPSLSEGQGLELIFNGLDTFATLWLNGEELGRSSNMFLPATFDVTDRVRPDAENILTLRFDPASASVKDKEIELWPLGAGEEVARNKRPLIRKAQFGWGWDWGPNLPTVGLYKPVELKVRNSAVISDVRFTTVELSEDHAAARVRVEVETQRVSSAMTAVIELRSPSGDLAFSRDIGLSKPSGAAEFELHRPQIWWTADLGAQPLYRLTVTLKGGGQALDQTTRTVGVRTIALDTSKDPEEPGTEFFRFVLNGAPIFARGACWIPANSYVGAINRTTYEPLLRAARTANYNMLRIWGGGIYEHDAFHDLCDELGLLVWQDFMFACAPYPDNDPEFVESVRQEAVSQVRRLRSHASTALWCGNNECQVINDTGNFMFGTDKPLLGQRLYDQVLKEVVAQEDPATPYWPGSPWGGPMANSMLAGDVHNWTVWHGFPPVPNDTPVGGFDRSPEGVAYTRYAEDMCRFVSEYGIQAAPVMETLRKCLAPEDLTLDSAAFLNHIKDNPKDKVNAMLVSTTGLPTTLQEYIDFTQVTQAEGLKFAIEHFRRRKPHCSGSLIWQHNDCWPCVSWSLVDFDGFAKAGYHYVRRAYAPVIASFKALEGGDIELWITNDTLAPLSGEADLALVEVNGGTLHQETIPWAIAANTSAALWRGAQSRFAAGPDRAMLIRAKGGEFPDNRLFFAPVKDTPFITSAPAHELEVVSPHEMKVQLKAAAFTYFVHILYPEGWTDFSDNYFDMTSGEERTITIKTHESPIDPARIVVRSWGSRAAA
jgi:beta-mannosidase